MISSRALGRALLERQLLLGRAELPVMAAVEHLIGLQAQAPTPPYYGLWSRLHTSTPESSSGPLVEREAVRLKLMRGTVHLVSVRDAPRLRPLVQVAIERGHTGAFRQRMGGADHKQLS